LTSSSANLLRFRALDSWRGICAVLVAAHHLEVHGFLYWQPLVRNAWLFVDFFFVLSGFVIAHAYGEKLSESTDIKVFVLKRFGRLWPLHVAVLLALVAIELSRLAIAHFHPISGEHAAFTSDRSVYAIMTNLALVQSFGLHPFDTWNGPAWSISVEFYTYLIFAAVCAAVPHRPARLAVALLLALVGLIVLARFSQLGMRETYHWALARCGFGFFLGTLTYEAWRRGAANALSGSWSELAGVVLVLAFITYVPGHSTLEYFATPLFCIVVLIFSGDRGILSHALARRAPAALGRWSYSIYMVHTLVLVVFFSAAHIGELVLGKRWLIHLPGGGAMVEGAGEVATTLMFAAYLGATIALAALTWRYIEKPGQRFFARVAQAKPEEVRAAVG
jgi:peptidoglycan/LPS O-acetylase OafA/YrhL